MNRTTIDWCDRTWNPVTGCLHDCEYCYARRIARRFGGGAGMELARGAAGHEFEDIVPSGDFARNPDLLMEILEPVVLGRTVAFPYGFTPTLHRYRLEAPREVREPQTVFVCSMADLFGEWVPEAWILAVLGACARAPWHRYLFLTKNPGRYAELAMKGLLPGGEGVWYGSTVTGPDEPFFWSEEHSCFVSIEPMLREIPMQGVTNNVDWVIVGAETGNRKGRVTPERR